MKGNNELAVLQESLATSMLAAPMFMLFCPQKNKREDFINKYLSYYLPKWAEKDELIIGSSKKCAVTLINPKDYKYNFSGKNGFALRMNGNAGRILLHRETVDAVVGIIVPEHMEKRVLTIYGNPSENLDEILLLIEQCKKKAEDEGFVLVYETLSKKLVPLLEQRGFETSYAKQFMNTQFFHTLMTYNF